MGDVDGAAADAAFEALKAEKEAFVSGHSGAPIWEVTMVVFVSPAGCLFYWALYAVLQARADRANAGAGRKPTGFAGGPKTWPRAATFALEFVCLVLPLILAFTATHLTVPMIAGFLGGAVLLRRFGGDAFDLVGPLAALGSRGPFAAADGHDSSGRHVTAADGGLGFPAPQAAALSSNRRPFMTFYRSGLVLTTAIAILAVDFTIYPRRFCKSETEGTGLMDAGVGGFVLASALVSKQARMGEAAAEAGAAGPGSFTLLKRALRSTSPVLAMGLVLGGARLVVLKAIRYQEHASEYGVHWNFFFTLAAVAVLSALLQALLQPLSFGAGKGRSWHFLALGLGMACVYEYALLHLGLRDYILTAPRVDLLSANREGICGLVGFLAVFLSGVWLGRRLLAPREGYTRWLAFTRYLVLATAIAWLATLASDAWVERISRRTMNLSYVLWALAFTLPQVTLLVCLDVGWRSRVVPVVPSRIIGAVNRNSLATFMLANMSTGLVNITMDTIHAPPAVGYAVVIAYMVWVTAVATAVHERGITLKFW